jgi:MerC mercury resistance protein
MPDAGVALRRRGLPIAGQTAGRALGAVGALACVLCCVSIPGIAAGLTALGLGFLRNDRILIPGTALSIAVLFFTLARARERHRRNAPVVAAFVATAMMWIGLTSRGTMATVFALAGAATLVAAAVWDAGLQRRCGR